MILSSSLSSGGGDIPGPLTSYDMSMQVPAPYRPVIPAVTEPAKPPEFDDVKLSFTERVDVIFEDLSKKYAELETQREALKNAVEAFQEEKAAHIELYEKQQKELEDMISKHRVENEEWINARKQELEEERSKLELEKSQLVEERERLRKEKIEFGEKIEAIEKLGGGTSHLINGAS